MPVLLLLRHAKSSWDDPALADFDRPLARRGLKAAPLIGAEIARRGWIPDVALVSTAVRAQQTWMRTAQAIDAATPRAPAIAMHAEPRLYLAEPETYLALLRALPAAKTALAVGHNPGMEDVAARLAGPQSDKAALRLMQEKFPTAALARLEFDGGWADLAFGAARLTHFLRPRDLAS